jgi:hypothetical protein
MRRAMGFGIATGTMMATTLMTPTPASAHNVSQESFYGKVGVLPGHNGFEVNDYACDGTIVVVEWYKEGNPLRQVATGNCSAPDPYLVGSDSDVLRFRKCASEPDLDYPCHPWVDPA